MERHIKRIAASVAEAFEAEILVEWKSGYPVTVNHEREADLAAQAAAKVFAPEGIIRKRPPIMGAEDFSYMLEKRPGAFVKLGQKAPDGKGGVPVHHPKYDFNDDAAPLGVGFFSALVEQELPRG